MKGNVFAAHQRAFKKTAVRIMVLTILVSMMVLPSGINAQDNTNNTNKNTDTDSDKINQFGLGVGLGVRWNVLKPDLVNEATIDANGIVRVNSRVNTSAGFWLEGHSYWTPTTGKSWGIGPFVAVQFGSDQIIWGGGAGLMVGFRNTSLGNGNSLGFGLGYAAIPKAKVLGSEFTEDQPAPKAPNGTVLPIRYQERDKGSLIFIVSFSFLGKK